MIQPTLQFNETAFRQHHADYPEIYELFKRFALERINAGATKLGAKMVWERIRWQAFVEKKARKWKLDNSMTAGYARLFCKDFPHHSEKFEFRKSRYDVEGVG